MTGALFKNELIHAARRLKRPSLRRCASRAAEVCLFALLGGSRMVSELSPFAAACFAAGLACRKPPASMLAGLCVYAALAGWTCQSLVTLAGCLLIGALHFFPARFLSKKKSSALSDVLAALEAGAGILIPGLAVSGGLPYNMMTAALSAVIASLLAPALSDALRLDLFSRRRFLPEERLSAALLAVVFLISAASFPYFGTESAQMLAALMTLVMAAEGPAMGAAGGMACGTALALGTGIPSFGSTLALGGLFAGCVSRLPRAARAAALCAGNTLALTYGIGYTLGALDWIPLLSGGALFCLMPNRLLQPLVRLIAPPADTIDLSLPIERSRRDTAARLERLAAAFEALSEGYAAESPADEARLIRQMRDALCAGCADYEKCWQGDHAEAGRLMCRLLSEALCQGGVTPLLERPPELVRHCRRSTQIDARLGPLLSETAEASRIASLRGNMKSLMSGQFRQAAAFLRQTGQSLSRSSVLDRDLSLLSGNVLEKAGFEISQAVVSRDARLTVTVLLKKGGWTASSARAAARTLSEALGLPLTFSAPDGGELRFSARPALSVRIGKGLLSSDSGAPCGDTAETALLPDGRLMIALSDGMGSGESAAAESLKTVRLVRTFLEAGLDSARSLEAVNALLQLGGRELFSTLDLCLIDLNAGQAMLHKLGACSTLLMRGGHVAELSGGHLPMGILEKVTPGEQIFSVRPGDVLIFHSDGIADDLREGQSLWLSQKALEYRDNPPRQMARRLLESAVRRDGDAAKDDMSVLVVRVDGARAKRSGRTAKKETAPPPEKAVGNF